MSVPFLDVARASAELGRELEDAVVGVLRRGRFVLGDECDAFEAEFAAYVGARHCVSVGNGLDALGLALIGLGIGPGDEVIVPGNTFIATWLAVTRAGATPVPVDPEPSTHTITGATVEKAIGPRTRAVVPVHLYGHAADMDPIVDVARRHGLAVLEDAAQSHGARYRGTRTGALGDAAAWSFYPSKNLGAAGDAGAITTNDAALAEVLRELRNYGSSRKYEHDRIGTNSRLDEMQAAVLRVKLRHLDEWNDRRRHIALTYLDALRACDLTLPSEGAEAHHVWYVFVVQTLDRDGLRRHLAAQGVETSVHYPVPPHLQPAYAHLELGPGSLPLSECLSERVLSLPMGPHMWPAEIDEVIEGVSSWAS